MGTIYKINSIYDGLVATILIILRNVTRVKTRVKLIKSLLNTAKYRGLLSVHESA